jgi:6-pyruvoyl-tetrahydropterin synthase
MRFTTGEAAQRGKRAPYRFNGEPTAENIAKVLFDRAELLLTPHSVRVVAVTVYETPTSRATYRPGAA